MLLVLLRWRTNCHLMKCLLNNGSDIHAFMIITIQKYRSSICILQITKETSPSYHLVIISSPVLIFSVITLYRHYFINQLAFMELYIVIFSNSNKRNKSSENLLNHLFEYNMMNGKTMLRSIQHKMRNLDVPKNVLLEHHFTSSTSND